MKLGIVANPTGASEQIEVLRSSLQSSRVESVWVETSVNDPGTGQTEKLLEQDVDVVVACGGDGTVRACAEALVGKGVPLGIVPAGTGNLLARNLELPDTADEALEVIVNGHRITVDVGRADGEVFTVVAGAGIDASIMRETSRDAKDRLGVFAYVIEGAKRVFDGGFDADIRFNGTTHSGTWASVLIGDRGRIQAGIDLFPEAENGDGMLDLLAIAAGGVVDTALSSAAAATGLDSDRLLRGRSAEFEIVFAEPVPYEIDGENRGDTTGLAVTTERNALTVCVPRRTT